MHSSDDKHYPLAKAKRSPQPRRAVSKKDYSLPKPYRRQPFSEEPERLTHLQVGMLGFAGLAIVTLLGVLALLAHESDRSPEGKMIVAAARLEPVDDAEAQLASYPAPPTPAEAPLPPALLHGVRGPELVQAVTAPARPAAKPKAKAKAKTKAPTRLASVPKKPQQHARVKPALLARAKKTTPPRKAPAVTAPAPDPDVALIAAILLLTPAPVPASTPAVALEFAGRAQATCAPAVPKDPACTELHKLKP